MEPPNYQPQPARHGEMCRNCRFIGIEKSKTETYCKKYEQTVRPNWFCENWERDGILRLV
jgi:hypothetical protein